MTEDVDEIEVLAGVVVRCKVVASVVETVSVVIELVNGIVDVTAGVGVELVADVKTAVDVTAVDVTV